MQLIKKMISSLETKSVNKLIFLLISVFFSLSVILFFYYNYDNRSQIIGSFNQSVENTLDFAEKAYQLPLWNLDKIEIKELNKALLQHKPFVAVNVYIENDLFYTGLKKVNPNQDFTNNNLIELIYPYIMKEGQEYIFDKKIDILYGNKKIGQLEVFYTSAGAEKSIIVRNFKIFISYLFMIFMIVLVIYWFINHKIIRPISYLAQTTNQVALDKDFQIRVKTGYKDEIAMLYNGFNFMLQNIMERDLKRDQMELELTVMKNYLNSIIQFMPGILISTNQEGLITQWNLAAEKYTGLKAEHVVDKSLSFVYNAFDPFIAEFEIDREPKYFNRQHMKNKTVLNINIYPISQHNQCDMVILAENVSELERKEDLLRQAQKMETVGTLAGGLAHDFNNILGGIIGTLSIIDFNLEKDKNIPYPKMRDYLDIMKKSSSRAAEMVQQLLTLSRKQEMTMAPVDLNLALAHVLKICRNTFDRAVEVIVKYSEQDPLIWGSSSHLEQVFLNLCINAYHAMTLMRSEKDIQGGILTVSVSKIIADRFFVKDHPEADLQMYWKIIIADTGVGMDKKTLEKIFEPFYTTKSKESGTGLGLTMVYNIIQIHKGFIDVYSEPDTGTTFSVFLPVIKEEQNILKTSEPLNFYQGTGTVLMADDEPTVLRIGREMLELCGYTILTAEDGEKAVSIYQDKKDIIDLILLDMIMPKKSGKEAFIEIRKINPQAKVILTSGFKQDSRVEKILESGIEAFIQKPYTLDKLSKTVYDVLKKKRMS